MKRPPFSTFPELSDDKILLVELTAEFAERAMELLTYDKKKAKTIDDALSMIDQINNDYISGDSVNWLIIDKATNEIAGTCGFNRGFDNECGEIGYVLRDAFKGKGYMSTTLKIIIQFAVNEMKLSGIFAHTKEDNLQSRILLERNSFIFERSLDDNYVEYIYRRE